MYHLIEVRRGQQWHIVYSGDNGDEATRMWAMLMDCMAPGWIATWENANGTMTIGA